MLPLRFAKFWLVLGWVFIGLIVYFSLAPKMPRVADLVFTDKVLHVTGYAGIMLWFAQIYRERRRHIWLGVGFVSMGVLLEILQGVQAYRTFEYADMLANGLGVLIGGSLAKTRLGTCLMGFENQFVQAIGARRGG